MKRWAVLPVLRYLADGRAARVDAEARRILLLPLAARVEAARRPGLVDKVR